MNELQIFNNEEFGEVRTVEKDGKILFCGSDVAKALGYSNTRDALGKHCKKDGVAFYDTIDSLGRTQETKFINEGNLYRLIVKSKLPSAEKFETWVFEEVLPSIRKTGQYSINNQPTLPTTYIEALEALVVVEKEKQKLLELNEQKTQIIKEYEPKVSYYDLILQTTNTVTITIIAKDYGMSAKTLNQHLYNKKVQYKQGGTWLLYSKYQDKGYTQSQTYYSEKSDMSFMNTQWTQKGRLFLYDLLKSDGILPLIEQDDVE